MPQLLDAIEQRLTAGRKTYRVELAGAALSSLHRLYELGEVMARQDDLVEIVHTLRQVVCVKG